MAKTGALLDFGDGGRIDRRAAPRADLFAQGLGAGERDRGSAPSSSLSAGRSAGLELDPGQAEQRGATGPWLMSTSWMRSNGIERWVRLRIPLSMRISLAPTRNSKRRQ